MKFTSIFFTASAKYIQSLLLNIRINERETSSLLQYFSQRAQSTLYNIRKNVRQDILTNACLTQNAHLNYALSSIDLTQLRRFIKRTMD